MLTNYSQILVHMDSSANACKRLRLAQQLGAQFDAKVGALFAESQSYLSAPMTPMGGANLMAMLQDLEDQRLKIARENFDKTVSLIPAPVSWSEARLQPVLPTFIQQAIYADLLVLGQYDSEESQGQLVVPDFVPSVILESGTAGLVLPYIDVDLLPFEVVVIAWQPNRHAMHAVTAALPLLLRAKEVHVVGWQSQQLPVSGAPLDLAETLRRRGVQAQWHLHDHGFSDVGEVLLSRVADLNADLLVMGCYGHSRAREWALGGVTRTILRSMTLPVLMAH